LTKVWRYLSPAGALFHYAARYDEVAPSGSEPRKKVLPFSLCRGPHGGTEWRSKAFAAPRPLYGLDRLTARPDAPVLVVEGEKTADYAGKKFPNYVVVTSSGGCGAARHSDWTPLAGRDVTVWRDADQHGLDYQRDVVAALFEIGAASVRTVQLPAQLPEKWDLADELPPGLTDADLSRLLAEAKRATAKVGKAEGGGVEISTPPLSDWPAPLPITSSLPSVEAFTPQLLPGAIRRYVVDVADRQQSPPDFAAVAAICGLAAVLGNKVRIRPKQHDDWEVVPTQWGAIIGRPSTMKSPSLTSALGPLYALQDDMRRQWESAHAEAALDDAIAKIDADAALKEAKKLAAKGNREAARQLLSQAGGRDENETPAPRLVVNDSSVEKLGELLNENPNGLLLVRDEITGFLARIESEEFQSERAFYLEAYNGDGRFTYDRIGRGTVEIDHCTVSMIGGIQPSRLAPIIRGAISGLNNDGLVQRLQLAVWPNDIGSWSWIDRLPDAGAREAYTDAFRRLHDLRLPPTFDDYAVLHFSLSAQAMFQEWMTEIQTEARGGAVSSALESHLLKMPKTIAGLALLFELVDGGTETVGERAITRALGWADYLRSHANRIYAAGETMAEEGARLILARRHQLPSPFTGRDIYRKRWAGLGERDVVAGAIEVLVDNHCCRPTRVDAGPSGGRPSLEYVWNPRLAEREHADG
jgi:hypothetical protein